MNCNIEKEKTEVWIRGRKFHKKTCVQFGEYNGEVTESSSNLLVVFSPAREDLKQDTEVPVLVANKFGSALYFGEKQLSFTYIVPQQTSPVTT